MRVLHVDTSTEWRGGQAQLLHLAKHQPGCMVLLPPKAQLAPALSEAGVAVAFGVIGRWQGRGIVAKFARDFDLVAAHTGHAHRLVMGCAKPIVVHRRLDFAPSMWSRARYRATPSFIAVSKAVRDVLVGSGVDALRVSVVLDVVDAEDVLAGDTVDLRHRFALPEVPVLVAAGALVAHKGQSDLVRALAGRKDVVVLLCGEGPLQVQLADEIRRYNSPMRLVGHQHPLGNLLRGADGFVHPSREEGFGSVLIEARIAGLPIVTTDAGGAPEAAGPLAIVCRRANPSALTAGIDELLASLGQSQRAARETVSEVIRDFAPARGAAETIAVYRRAAEGR